MKKGFIGVLFACTVALCSTAQADVTITTGSQGGAYFGTFGVNLASAMSEFDAFRPVRGGEKVNVVTSLGSLENLSRVSQDPNTIGFVQADALMYWASQNQGQAAKVDVLGELPNDECLFMITKKGGIEDYGDLVSKKAKIAIGDTNSGSYSSWQYVVQLDDSYKAIPTIAKQGAAVLNKVTTGGKNGVDAYFFVASSSASSNPNIKAVLAKGSQLQLIDFDDSDFNDELPSGEPVYKFKTVEFGDYEVDVPCTRTLVVNNVDAKEELLNTAANIRNNHNISPYCHDMD